MRNEFDTRRDVAQRRHDLPGELIISLTSYPPRFQHLDLTLNSILRQSVRPDRVILWLAHDDLPRLPDRIRALSEGRFEIRSSPDVRSYKKLVYALRTFPHAHIVTADDDLLFRPDWLADLTDRHEGPGVILCHRAHRMPPISSAGLPDYRTWEWEVDDERARLPSVELVPTGGAGVLYPPGSLHPDATNEGLFLSLAPTADDLWFYWMARRAGSTFKKVGGRFELKTWPGSQKVALFRANFSDESGNDRQIRNLLERYGYPPGFGGQPAG